MPDATLMLLIGVFLVSVIVTYFITHLFYSRRRRPAEVPEHVKREATELRRRVARLNTGSDDIEERARRLEEMLAVKKQEER